jgi:catechol 2,3-dioxygenase-like lactoylglutathione lyase family enzyme
MRSIVGIGHVAIRVKDIERTLAFYVGKLGFSEMMRLDRDGRLWLLYLRITDTQYLEVFPEAEGDRAPPREANGLNHLCLEVDDIDTAVADLEAAGVPLTSPRKQGADGNLQAWIEDPDGNRIELMQMASDSLQAKAIARLRGAGTHRPASARID